MENIEGRKLKFWNVKNLNIKAAALSIWLLLSSINFSYWKNNEWSFDIDQIEQNDESLENFPDFENMIRERNARIGQSSEDLNKFISRMENQFEYEITNNSDLKERISEVKNILNSKYSQNITSEDAYFIMKSAFKVLSKTEKYRWLWNYSNKFSDGFDINFVNALWFSQYVNWLNCNRNLTYGWTTTLDRIISDLNNLPTANFNDNYNSNHQWKEISRNEAPRQDLSWQWNREWNRWWNKENDVIVDNTPDNLPVVQPNEDLAQWVQLLSNNLSSQKLNGVTYEEVRNCISSINHEWLRNAVLNCFLHNDVIWAQKLLWMSLNCDRSKYPNYVASERIWHRELNLMEKYGQTRRLMEPWETINFFSKREAKYRTDKQDENFTYEVKTIYKKFLSWEINNKGLPYCIISKYDYNMYLFSADHKLLSCHPVLTWADRWNEPNDLDPKVNRQTTPWWIYTIRWPFDKSLSWKQFRPLYWSDYFTLYPEQGQYVYSRKYTLWMHGYLISRGWRMVSAHRADHAISNWCVNCDRATFWELINHLKEWSVVFVCFDDETNNKYLGYTPENDIELIEHFGYNPGYAICRDDIHQPEASSVSNKWNSVINSKDHFAHNSIINKKLVGWELPKSYNIFNLVTSSTSKNIGKTLAKNNIKSYNPNQAYVS